ncbi:MAG: hypothetical protein LQ340_002111 [Diploschistes diacapsis]|nr:MAG: hypothetical protein LQ340_002111 [Diploschistes diacapsis]
MASDTAKRATEGPYPAYSTASRVSQDEKADLPRSQPLVPPEELEGKTLYEKKCILIDREINRMGMGKYQWCLWGLCGFGYLLDLLWAEAFGLVLAPLSQELNIIGTFKRLTRFGLLPVCRGAAFWGILVDIIGRRWAFNLTCLFSSAFGLGLAGSNDYNTFLVLTAFVGFGVGGNIPIDTTITLEFIPQRHRRLLPFLSVFQPVGVVICTAIAYGFIPQYSCDVKLPSCLISKPGAPCCGKQNNFGWRYTLLTVGAITMGVFILRFFAFRFHESPKFLMYRGKDEAAVTVMQEVAKFNKQKCGLTYEMLQNLTDDGDSTSTSGPTLGGGKGLRKASLFEKLKIELQRYKILFSNFTMARLTTLVWLTYACDFWGFTIAGAYTPLILAKKNASASLSIYDTYKSYIYIYLPGTVGVLLGVLGYDLPRVGRKWTMVVSSALMAASLFLFATVNNVASNIGLSVLEYFFQSMFNSVLYGWTPEAFPSYIRGTACGVASFFGRLFSIVAPLAAQTLLPNVPTDQIPWQAYAKLLYMGGGVAFGATLFTALLPGEKVKQLETM